MHLAYKEMCIYLHAGLGNRIAFKIDSTFNPRTWALLRQPVLVGRVRWQEGAKADWEPFLAGSNPSCAMMFSEKWATIHLRELHSERGELHWPQITQLGNSPAGMLSVPLSVTPQAITRSSALLHMLSALQPPPGIPWVSV